MVVVFVCDKLGYTTACNNYFAHVRFVRTFAFNIFYFIIFQEVIVPNNNNIYYEDSIQIAKKKPVGAYIWVE